MDPQAVHRTLTGNVLATGEPSVPSRIVLQRYGLAERYEDDRKGALAELHRMAILEGERRPEDLFALAELSFDHAEHGGGRPYALATAVYAWTLLFEPGVRGRELDPRLRTAADLYNRGLTVALASTGTSVELRPGSHALPFGSVDIVADPSAWRWGDRRLVDFTAASELGVIGLRNRYRDPGIGAPLNAATAPIDPEEGYRDFVFPRVKVPVTALLRLEDAQSGLASGRFSGRIVVYAASETQQVEINGRSVALEYEPSSALADALTNAPVWKAELRGFLTGDLIRRERLTQLGAIEPYRSDRVPVVLVHGTASSPGRWADMLNDLANEARIRERFQFWFFSYDTGNPIVYSGLMLREALTEAVARLDPDGNDACLRHMVVIGHSQGGLLAKLTAIDSGNRFWESMSPTTPLQEMKVSAETRDLLQRGFFIKAASLRAPSHLHRHPPARELPRRRSGAATRATPGEVARRRRARGLRPARQRSRVRAPYRDVTPPDQRRQHVARETRSSRC